MLVAFVVRFICLTRVSYATDGEPVGLVVEGMAHADTAVEEVPAVRVVSIVLGRTPVVPYLGTLAVMVNFALGGPTNIRVSGVAVTSKLRIKTIVIPPVVRL